MRNEIIKITLSNRLPDLPVSLETVKEALIVEHADDDALITRLIKSAVGLVESKTKRLLSQGTVTVILKARCNQLILPRIPFISITTFEILENEAWVAFTDYVKIDEYIELYKFGTFKIVYEAGYTDTNLLPEGLANVVITQVAYTYENRGDKLRQLDMCQEADKLITQYLNLSWL